MSNKRRTPPKNPILKYNEDLSCDQKIAKDIIGENAISVILGKAGSGKTHLATIAGLEHFALQRKEGGINKLVLIRPTVFRKEDNIGFLPGDVDDKYDPWIRPVKEILVNIEGGEKAEKMFNTKAVEVLPMMFAQGRTFTHTFVIIDEAENLTREGMIGILSRIGKGSKMVFCGDMPQCLLPRGTESGLPKLIKLSEKIEGISTAELISNFRHPILDELLEEY